MTEYLTIVAAEAYARRRATREGVDCYVYVRRDGAERLLAVYVRSESEGRPAPTDAKLYAVIEPEKEESNGRPS